MGISVIRLPVFARITARSSEEASTTSSMSPPGVSKEVPGACPTWIGRPPAALRWPPGRYAPRKNRKYRGSAHRGKGARRRGHSQQDKVIHFVGRRVDDQKAVRIARWNVELAPVRLEDQVVGIFSDRQLCE